MKSDMESVVSDAGKALDTLEGSPMNTKDNMLVSDSTSNAASGVSSDVSSSATASATEDVSDNHKNPNPNNAPGYKPKSSATQNAETKDPDQKTAGAKLTRTAARGAAAYFTGGQSLQYDQEVGKVAQPLVDGVGNVIDKTPGVSQAAEALDDVGALDVAEHGLNTAGDALKGNIGGAIKEGFKTVKGVNKMLLRILLCAAPLFLLFFMMIMVVILPIADGIMKITSGDGSQQAVVDGATQSGSLSTESINDMVNETPSISEMASDRQKIIATAASAVGMNYNWGGHPNGPGLAGIPTKGLDCAGYVQWVLWTALGENPGYLTTSSISQQIGSNFIRITQDQLQPGDIGLKRLGGSSESSTNHTGIYAGNGQWYHAQGKNSGIVHNSYNSFTIYLRYKGVS